MQAIAGRTRKASILQDNLAVGRRQVSEMIADDIYHDTAPNLILTILGQDRFSEMKRNSLLVEEKKATEIKPAVGGLEMLSFDPLPDLGANNITDGSKVKKYQEALKYILDEGPKHHVHVLMQVDKPGNILFDEFGKEAIGLFKHRVILKSETSILHHSASGKTSTYSR